MVGGTSLKTFLMSTQFTTEQTQLMDKLHKLSNGVSNDLFFAETKPDADVDKYIDQAIWFAKFMIERIEEIKMASASKKEKVLP
jgi:hypothetical protein